MEKGTAMPWLASMFSQRLRTLRYTASDRELQEYKEKRRRGQWGGQPQRADGQQAVTEQQAAGREELGACR